MAIVNDIDAVSGKRQEKRDSLFLTATVRVHGTESLVTRVRNLSAGGMMIDAPVELIVDARLVADIRGLGEIEGRVAWCTAGRAGVAFDAEIDPKLARHGSAATKPATPEFLKSAPGKRPGLSVR